MKVEVLVRAVRDLDLVRRLDPSMVGRLVGAIDQMESGFEGMDVKKLRGLDGLYRLRIDGYRIFFVRRGERCWVQLVSRRAA